MLKKDLEQIKNLFKKYSVEGFINVSLSNSKDLTYSPLHDEVSLDSSENISTSVVIIKDNKKSAFNIDGYSLDKVESSIKDML